MATKKISQLEAITEAEDSDVLVIVDVSEGTTNKITKGNLLLGSGHSIEMTLDPQTYQLVLKLKNAAGTELSTQSVDLPNENAVTGIEYENGILTITKQVGEPSTVDLSPLIEGLVTESDFNTFTQTLAETIQGINDKDEEQDEAIEENYKEITKLKSKVAEQEEIINQLPQVSGEGESVTLNNTIKAPFTLFSPEGHSEQETTEGYQLLPNALNSASTNAGITFTPYFNERGDLLYINVNGTATGTAYYDLYNNTNKRLIDDTTSQYTFTLVNNVMIKQIYERIDGSWRNTYSYSSNTAYTPSEGSTGQLFRILVNSGTTLNNEKIYPMVYKGAYDSSKAYEPYTNGASPNPSYEQPIKSAGENVNEFDKTDYEQGYCYLNQSKSANVNWGIYYYKCKANKTITISGLKGYAGTDIMQLDVNKNPISRLVNRTGKTEYTVTATENGYIGISFVWNESASQGSELNTMKIEQGSTATPYSPYGMGSITEKIVNRNLLDENYQQGGLQLSSDGSETGQANRVRTDFTPITSSETYKITNYNDIVNNLGIGYYDKNKKFISAEVSGGWTSFPYTLTTPINAKYVRFAFRKSTNENITPDLDYKIILNKASSSIPYTPHEEQTYSIYTQQPMRSNKDKTVRDCFVKKSDGWYERHYFGKVEQLLDLIGPVAQGFYFIPQGIKKEARLLSTHQQLGTTTASEEWQRFDGSQMKQLYPTAHNGVYINYKADTRQEQIDWWNSLNNILLYELEKPLDLPCTEEQIQQLENIPSTFSGQTNVFSEDEVKAYLRAKGLLDLNTLDSEINNVKQAIVALGGVV